MTFLADRCAGPLGRRLARGLPFAETREQARSFHAQAAEASRLLEEGRPLPVGEVEDVQQAIERVRVGGILAPVELRGIARMLAAARVLRRFLSSQMADLPALYRVCTTDPTLDGLADEIARCFDTDGTLADRASPRLSELRAEWHAARQRMISRMEELMARYEGVIQDRFITEREGRWVLPVRSDSHDRFPGIVHATSASGATLFVEPRAVVPMGNRLKVLEAEVKREEDTVYARLSAMIGDSLPSVAAAAEALALADVRAATARLAHDAALRFPELVDEPRLDLKRARHLLLALDIPSVVASDVSLAAGHAMVVSGPNAGGKTVALKTMGLTALMARAGMPVACGDGSVVGLFDVVLTDVGDEQSLQKNLSTFSAHVSNLAAILRETMRGALVLLDELAGGTDPREGEALAAGMLDSLCARGGAVAVTTHYEGLKALALADDRFVNASVGFDIATMSPTFRLAMGVPGSSSALAVARRFGIPETVIERAERFMTREGRSFEAVVQKLHDERAATELAKTAAEQREREALAALVQLESERAAAKDRARRTLYAEARDLAERLQRAREDLRAAQAKLRAKKVDPASVREAERAIERVASEVALGGSLEPLLVPMHEASGAPVSVEDVRKGMRVWVTRLRAEADVMELLPGEQVRVAAGALKLKVPLSELRSIHSGGEGASRPSPRGGGARPGVPRTDFALPTQDCSCDLRGLRVDDAISMATSFLDRALNEGRQAVFLIHGHGTGALRDALRKELARSAYVARMESAEPDHGGEGVTVVWLA